MMMLKETMNAYLEEQFEKYVDNLAIIYPEGNITYTYREMSDRINLLAKGLISIGVKKETHVSLLAPSSPDWIMYYLALTKIGAIPVCLNDKNTFSELQYLLKHSDSYAAVVSKESLGENYDSEGYLIIKGRKKELIIRGGENISPVDIEDVIRTYAMVDDVAVVGVPDSVLGEEIESFVIMKQGSNYIKFEIEDYIS